MKTEPNVSDKLMRLKLLMIKLENFQILGKRSFKQEMFKELLIILMVIQKFTTLPLSCESIWL
jgi:hypothetical protein